ncbi:MAG: hypothetical protein OYK82_04715 [Gammaproteobacteria bacterium]|nr:hypothetical protein [Gammaproteobacteria bacterium]
MARGTVSKFLITAGEFCSIYQHHRLRNLNCRRIQADEIWSFVEAKAKNARYPHQGDIWTYTALDEDSRLNGVVASGRQGPEVRHPVHEGSGL